MVADILKKIESTAAIKVIREALASMIPVVTIGAFALIIRTFPVGLYQEFYHKLCLQFYLRSGRHHLQRDVWHAVGIYDVLCQPLLYEKGSGYRERIHGSHNCLPDILLYSCGYRSA